MKQHHVGTLISLLWLCTACGGDDGSPEVTSSGGTETETAGSSTTSTSTSTTTSTSTSTSASTGSSGTTEAGSTSGESTGTGEEPSSARHTPISIGTNGAPQGYWEYVPPGFDEGLDEPPPLLVFLHGIAANGNGDTELDRILETAIPRTIQNDQWPSDRPFVVLSPQHGGDQCPPSSEIETFLGWAIDNYAIDDTRVYLTAVSCGAFGGWNYLAQVPDTQIAATVLIAGNGAGPFTQAGCDLARVPIWAFHGDADDVVPVEGTTGPINGLLDCTPTPDVQMTIYPGVGHNSWTRTYDGSAGHDVFGWMLSYP